VKLVLASASPARLATLRRAGVEPEVVVSGVDETGAQAASPGELAGVLARLKAEAVAGTLADDALVLGCDSLFELDGRALGKPGSPQAAADRWREMRGRSGVLHTGHVLIDTVSTRSTHRVVSTRVHFANVDEAEIESYAATGEPVAVAGAFTIDGLGGWFVTGVEGDPHNVVGVSLPVVREMLQELGLTLADIGYPALR
jgi:septum formation protein